ncbi:MAG: hypothetical protein J5I93_06830, partial [Pirellulaceae bacterium]|nr:hypothetical protein [Pirellulaceae bacterium]
RQQAAADAAREADAAAARQHADDAQQKLATAERQLEERLRQLQQDLFEEQLARLEQLVTGLISRQSALLDATVQLHQSQQEQSGQLTRPQLATLGDLAAQQRTLSAETGELARKLGQARAFVLALEGVLRDMARAARGLDRHDPGLDTQQAESSALARLRQLALALKQDEPSPPEEEPPAEQPAGQPMPAEDAAGLLAELKLIKLMQQQLLERTTELEAIRDGGQTWTREQELEATELAAEQGQLAALVLELLNPKEP